MKKKQSLSKILLTAMFAFAMLVLGIMVVLPQNTNVGYAETTQTYTVTYDANAGGDIVNNMPTDSNQYNEGDTVIIKSEIPTRDGYRFSGWDFESTITIPSLSAGYETVVYGDITFYAIWAEIGRYTYNYSYWDIVPEASYNAGDTITIISNCTTSCYFIINDKTFYHPVFSEWFKNYTIKNDGATLVLENCGNYGKAMLTDGYKVTYDDNVATEEITVPTDDNYYGEPFAYDNVTYIAGKTVTISSEIPTRTGYKFLGWSTTEGATTATYFSGDTFTIGTSNETLYAVWEKETYTITYNNVTDATNPNTATTYDIETETITLQDASKSGYKFLGWFDNENGTGTAITQITKGSTGNKTLYAVWGEFYTIVYNINGGPGTAPTGVSGKAIGDSITLADGSGFTVGDCYFVGWSTDPNATTGSTGSYTILDSDKPASGDTITFYAIWWEGCEYWTLNEYHLSLIEIPSTIQFDISFIAYDNTTEKNKIYSKIKVDCDNMYYDDTKVYDEILLWNGNQYYRFLTLKTSATGELRNWLIANGEKTSTYAISYDFNATDVTGTLPTNDIKYMANENVTLASTDGITKDGYNLLGWNTDKNATNALASYTAKADDAIDGTITLYAIWQEKTTVSIDENAQEFTYGDENIAFSISGNITTDFSVTYYASGDWTTPITPKNAGNYNVKITRPTDTDYKVYSKDIENGLVINQKEVVLDWSTLSADDLIYTGQAKLPTASVSNLCGLDTCTVTANLTTNKDNVNVGTFTFTATALSNNNYKLPTNITSPEYTITQATTEITGLTLTGWVYGKTANTPSATSNFGAIIYTYSIAENGEYTEQQPTNAGTYYVKASVTGNANYTSAETKTTFEITRATYDMTNAKWNYTEAFTYDGTPKIVEVTGLPNGVTVQTYSNNAKTDAGDYIASAILDYDTINYFEPTLADLNWAIKPKGITLTIVDIASVTYDGNRKTTTATYTSLVGDDTLTYKLLYGDNVNVGTCEVAIFSASITSGNASNYNVITSDNGTIVIEKGNALISVNTTPIVKTYGEVVEIPQASSNFGTVICDKTSDDLVNAGNYVITYTVAGTTNFNGDTKTVNVTINKANNEITSFVMTSWTYGEVASTPQAVVSYGTPSYTYSTTQNGEYTTTQPSDAGIYFIKLKIEESENYKEASLTVSFTIAKAQAVIDVDTTNIVKSYGETITIPSATTNYGTVSCDKTSADLVHAGNYKINYTVTGTNNYNGATEIINVTINKAQNSITDLTVDNVYCGTKITPTATSQFGDVTYSYKLSNTEDWETLSFENYPQKVGTYLLKVQVAGTSDYTDATANTTFEILSKEAEKADIPNEEKIFENTKVEVVEGSLESDTVVAITKNDNTENSKTINENVKKAVTNKSEIIAKFDINLKKQSGGYVENIAGNKYKVTLTLTEDLLNKTGYAVVYIDDNNNVAKVNSTVTNNTIVFETDHFSTWAIVADGQSSDNNNLLIYILGGIALFSTACCVFLLITRKKPVNDVPNTNNVTSTKTKSKK